MNQVIQSPIGVSDLGCFGLDGFDRTNGEKIHRGNVKTHHIRNHERKDINTCFKFIYDFGYKYVGIYRHKSPLGPECWGANSLEGFSPI